DVEAGEPAGEDGRGRGGDLLGQQLGEELAGDDGGQAPVVAGAGDEEEALGVPVSAGAGERLVEDEEGGGEEGGDDVFGVVEVALDAARQLGAGDPPAAAAVVPMHEFRLDVYFPLFQMRSRDTAILLHLRGNSQQAASELNGIMQSIDPSIPFYDVETPAIAAVH